MLPAKMTMSALGLSIVGDIEAFIKANSQQAANSDSATPDDGAKALANAIAYGIAIALASPTFQAAMSAGVCGAPGTPVGTTMYSLLKPFCIEP